MSDTLCDLRDAFNDKEIFENENPDKVIHIVEEILNFNKQQKGKGCPSDSATCLKILISKEMLQRLPIALAQVKAVNTSEKLLNEIRHITSSLYRAKEITKKVHNNIMNSIKV